MGKSQGLKRAFDAKTVRPGETVSPGFAARTICVKCTEDPPLSHETLFSFVDGSGDGDLGESIGSVSLMQSSLSAGPLSLMSFLLRTLCSE